MYVTVVGGNSTPIFATLAKEAGHKVAPRHAGRPNQDIGFTTPLGYADGKTEIRTEIDLVTADPAECIPRAI